MLLHSFLLALAFGLISGDLPLQPLWSPDHQVLARTQVEQRFVTPAGAGYCLVLNDRPTYPVRCDKPRRHPAYTNIHNFLSELAWSPDSRKLAVVEKIYDWEYSDPYNRDFDGEVKTQRFFLAIVSRDGPAAGFQLESAPPNAQPRWTDGNHLVLNGRTFDLNATPPQPIP